jgi:hypothetical protein
MNANIISIGKAVSIVHAMPARIREAAAALGIEPEMRINGAEHYAEADVERIAEYLGQQVLAGNSLARRAGGLH